MPVAHRMIADARFDACLARAPLNHPVAVLPGHALRSAGEAPRRPRLFEKQGRGLPPASS